MANAEIEAFEKATRRSRTIKLTLLVLLVLSPLIWVIYKNVATRQEIAKHEEEYQAKIALTDAEKQHMRETIPATRKQIEAAATTFVTVVNAAALDALEDAGTACNVRVTPASAKFALYTPGQPIKPGVSYELATLDEIGKELAEGKADKHDLERLERMTYRLDNELFVVGERREPVVLADSYLPGSLTGYAYLYSHQAKRVVCFAAIAAQNSPAIDIKYTHMEGNILDEQVKKDQAARDQLVRDLDENIRNAIAARLQATL